MSIVDLQKIYVVLWLIYVLLAFVKIHMFDSHKSLKIKTDKHHFKSLLKYRSWISFKTKKEFLKSTTKQGAYLNQDLRETLLPIWEQPKVQKKSF